MLLAWSRFEDVDFLFGEFDSFSMTILKHGAFRLSSSNMYSRTLKMSFIMNAVEDDILVSLSYESCALRGVEAIERHEVNIKQKEG